jgi:hypothetical protein
VALVLLARASLCAAEPRSATVAAEPSTRTALSVFVDFVAIEDSAPLNAKIASWFSSQGAAYASSRRERFEMSELLDERAPGMHVFVTRTQPELLRIFFVFKDGPSRRFLVREIALPTGLDEVGLENAAQVVFSASIALWEGREETPIERISPPPSPTPAAGARLPTAPRDEPRARAPARAKVYVVTALGYAARYRGALGFAQGPRFSLGLARRSLAPREFGLSAAGTLLLPQTITEPDLSLLLSGYSFSLEPWLEVGRSGSWRWLASLAVGVDLLNASPQAVGTQVAPGSPTRHWDPFLAPRFGAYFQWAQLSFGVAFDLSAQIVGRHYDISEAGESHLWLQAWRIQPGLLVQVIWRERP